MDILIPQGMRAEAHPHQRTRKPRTRLRLKAGEQMIDVAEAWEDGLALPIAAPHVRRGLVDLFDGERHLTHGLIYQTGETGDQRIYAFKSVRDATAAPPLDYAREATAPVALITGPDLS